MTKISHMEGSPQALPSSAAGGAGKEGSSKQMAPKKKICCACPDTKEKRDMCIAEKGPEACAKYIEAHKICLRSEGFKNTSGPKTSKFDLQKFDSASAG
eukprot:jgi/Mesen1/378/ME000010S_10835